MVVAVVEYQACLCRVLLAALEVVAVLMQTPRGQVEPEHLYKAGLVEMLSLQVYPLRLVVVVVVLVWLVPMGPVMQAVLVATDCLQVLRAQRLQELVVVVADQVVGAPRVLAAAALVALQEALELQTLVAVVVVEGMAMAARVVRA